jgi:hypothetical protein
MASKLTPILLCPFIGLSALALPPATPAPRGKTIHVGGYSPAPTDTPLVTDAKAFLQASLPSWSFREVVEAYTQVVAGLNVKLVCDVTEADGPSQWQFVAFRSLDGRWHLTSAERL